MKEFWKCRHWHKLCWFRWWWQWRRFYITVGRNTYPNSDEWWQVYRHSKTRANGKRNNCSEAWGRSVRSLCKCKRQWFRFITVVERKANNYPRVSLAAHKWLSVCSTSTPSERVFNLWYCQISQTQLDEGKCCCRSSASLLVDQKNRPDYLK